MGTLYTKEQLSALAQRSMPLQEQCLCHFQDHIWCGYFLILGWGGQGRTRKQNHFIHCNSCAPKILLASQVHCYCLEILFCLTAEKKDKEYSLCLKPLPIKKIKQNKTNKETKTETNIKTLLNYHLTPSISGSCRRARIFLQCSMWNKATGVSVKKMGVLKVKGSLPHNWTKKGSF